MTKIRFVNLKLSEEHHKDLKLICSENGQSMQFVIQKLISEYVIKKKEKKGSLDG